MSRFGNLGRLAASLLFEEESPTDSSEEQTDPATAPVQVPKGVERRDAVATAETVASLKAGDQDELKERLRAQLDVEVPEAYRRLQETLAKLKPTLGHDKPLQIKTALSLLAGEGFSSEVVLEAFQERLAEVDEWKDNFEQQAAKSREDLDRQTGDQVAAKSKAIEELEGELERVKKDLEEARIQKRKIEEDRISQNAELEQRALRTREACDNIHSDLEAELAEISAQVETTKQQEGGEK